MLQKLHKNAKTNYNIRQAIKASSEPISALAKRFDISWLTAMVSLMAEDSAYEYAE